VVHLEVLIKVGFGRKSRLDYVKAGADAELADNHTAGPLLSAKPNPRDDPTVAPIHRPAFNL
jgi:hypothetical protein